MDAVCYLLEIVKGDFAGEWLYEVKIGRKGFRPNSKFVIGKTIGRNGIWVKVPRKHLRELGYSYGKAYLVNDIHSRNYNFVEDEDAVFHRTNESLFWE